MSCLSIASLYFNALDLAGALNSYVRMITHTAFGFFQD